MGQAQSHSDDEESRTEQRGGDRANNNNRMTISTCAPDYQGRQIQVNPNGAEQQHSAQSSRKANVNNTSTSNDIKFQHKKPSSKFNPFSSNNNNNKDNSNNNNNSKSTNHNNNKKQVRKLSNVSHRNIQLLSMKPRGERDAYVDDLRARRRSSLINLILGAPSSGPRFSDDLCSINSKLTNFGIEFLPDFTTSQHRATSTILSGAGSSRGSTLQSVRFGATESIESGLNDNNNKQQCCVYQANRRRSSEGSLAEFLASARDLATCKRNVQEQQQHQDADQVHTNTVLASIDLTGSFDKHHLPMYDNDRDEFARQFCNYPLAPQRLCDLRQPKAQKARRITPSSRFLRRSGSELSLYSSTSSQLSGGAGQVVQKSSGTTVSQVAKFQVFAPKFSWRQKKRFELGEDSLDYYQEENNNCSSEGIDPNEQKQFNEAKKQTKEATQHDPLRETKSLIIMQVCLPFIFAGFGNMGAGLVLARIANWDVARHVSTFLVILPPLVGLKGNIEMTLASRLSTLANLNLLDTAYRRRRAFVSNLVLILSQAIGLSLFAALVAIICDMGMSAYSSPHHHHHQQHPSSARSLIDPDVANQSSLAYLNQTSSLAISKLGPLHEQGGGAAEIPPTLSAQILLLIASALATSMVVVCLSSLVIALAIILAKLIQVNPDNLSTLIAALYGDVSFVLIYGLIASYMNQLIRQVNLFWPSLIIGSTLSLWPVLLFGAYKFKETHEIALSSLPPMLASIMISMGSGAVLSIVVKRFALLALYQPIVNGFSANLVAVQASRVSTWLWCSALERTTEKALAIEANDSPTKTNAGGGLVPLDAALIATAAPSDLLEKQKNLGSLASFVVPTAEASDDQNVKSSPDIDHNGPPASSRGRRWTKSIINASNLIKHLVVKRLFWSFTNRSPNSVAAKLLLIMLIPAHTLYFLVIWLLFSSPPAATTTATAAAVAVAKVASSAHVINAATTTIHLTWSFYLVYLTVCIIQVFILFLICEPFMSMLMSQGYDPDIIGISILMALADLTGTLFLTGAFYALAALGDVNAAAAAAL